MTLRLLLAATAICGGVHLGAATAAEPELQAAFPSGKYHTLEALPDWGGVWVSRPASAEERAKREKPQAKGKYLDELNANIKAAEKNNGETPRTRSYCAAPGLPYIMGVGQYPLEFLFTPGRITVLHEAWTGQRRIYTDGRKHVPDDELDPSFYGDSVGRWEGQTLVVDTVGLKDETDIAVGLKHSTSLRVQERIYLDPNDPDILVDEMVLTDPEALEKPFNQTFKFNRRRDIDLMEFVCAENERNALNEDGLAGSDHD